MRLTATKSSSQTVAAESQIQGSGASAIGFGPPSALEPERSSHRLEVDRVSVTYRDRSGKTLQALEDVCLTVEGRELVVVLGTSGCGKTTLLNIIAGFMTPTRGAVYLDGQEIKGPGAERGMVFQSHTLMPWLSVRENVELGLKFQGVAKPIRREIAERTLALVDLQEFYDRPVYELSGGMQQRVGLARALANDPAVLLMDEPLGALDALTRENMQELVLRVWQETGKTIVLITHSVEEAVFMATRLIIMSPRPGRITNTFDLQFCRAYLSCADARAVKSDHDFIEMREAALSIIRKDQG